MMHDPLRTLLLDLHRSLAGQFSLIIAGGYGLYLKHQLIKEKGTRTLFSEDKLPTSRTTEDIDLFLEAEVVIDDARMKAMREALTALGMIPIESAKYYQFEKNVGLAGKVRIDLLVGPMGHLSDSKNLKMDSRRARAKGFADLHAHPVPEAIAVEDKLFPIRVSGELSDTTHTDAEIFIPQAFSYLMMKLFAYRDRKNDDTKDYARHHALDIYRIVGLMTEKEYQDVLDLSKVHRENEKVREARMIVGSSFATQTGEGVLSMKAHRLYSPKLDIGEFVEVMAEILPPN